MPRPGRCVPEKTQYPLYKRMGGPQGLSGWAQKISATLPVAHHYSEHAVLIPELTTAR